MWSGHSEFKRDKTVLWNAHTKIIDLQNQNFWHISLAQNKYGHLEWDASNSKQNWIPAIRLVKSRFPVSGSIMFEINFRLLVSCLKFTFKTTGYEQAIPRNKYGYNICCGQLVKTMMSTGFKPVQQHLNHQYWLDSNKHNYGIGIIYDELKE